MADDSEFHPVTLASETQDLQAGPISRIGDALTKGIPAAAVSGGLSIWNTVSNYVGGDEVSVTDKLRQMDTTWGDYYDANKSPIDMVGFVGTSIVPFMAGTKLLQLARAGSAGTSLGSALNLTASRKAYYLEQALKETAESGGTIKSILSQTRLKQLGWDMADNALTSTAGELLIAATMNDSPVFDGDSLGDFAWNVAFGAGFGGVLGGTFSSIGAKGILKDAQRTIESNKRLADTVFDPEKLGLSKGTEIMLLTEDIANLPKSFTDTPFKYKFDGTAKSIMLDTAGAFKQAQGRAIKTAEDRMALKFNDLAQGEAVVGQEYFQLIKTRMEAARAAGKDANETMALINGYLTNLNKIGHIDLEQVAIDSKKHYANLEPTSLADMFTLKRIPGKTGKTPYMLADHITDGAQLKVVKFVDTGEDSLKAAWRSGIDADVIQMPNGRLSINPNSENIKRIAENPNKVRMFVDLPTGSLSDEAVIHFADTAKSGTVRVSPLGISGGGRKYPQAALEFTDITQPALVGSARHAWVSQLDLAGFKKATGGAVDTRDLAALSRYTELAQQHGRDALASMKLLDNGVEMTIDDILDMNLFLREKKYEVLVTQLGMGEHYDLRHIAAHFNSSVEFLEDAIQKNFTIPHDTDKLVPDFTTAQALVPKTIQAEWNFTSVKDLLDPLEAYKQQFGPAFAATVELSRHYQLATRELINRNAMNAVLGDDAKLFWQVPKDLALQTGQQGAGAGVVTASNADYAEKARLWVQDSGKNVALVSQSRRDSVVSTFIPHISELKGNVKASAETAILTNALRKSEYRYMRDPEGAKRLVSEDVVKLAMKEKVDIDTAFRMVETQMVAAGKTARVPHLLDIEHDATLDFLATHTKINSARQEKFTVLHNATGQVRYGTLPGLIYVPPVNTVKYPFHAFVKTKERIGVASETTMITARTDDELRTAAAQIQGDKYDVLFKADTDAYFKAKGEYDYDMTLNESRINSDLARTGTLSDHLPDTRLENVMTDYLEFHSKQEEKLVRMAVQVGNRQFFSEMRVLSANYRVVNESVTRGIGSAFKRKIEDPFDDYIKTALNISKQQEFPLLDSLNEFVDKLGYSAGEAYQKAFGDAQKGLVGWDEADKISKRFGLGAPYSETNDAVKAYLNANAQAPKNLIRETFQKANMLLANFTLRLDHANSLINMISTPIMIGTELSSIRFAMKSDPALLAQFEDLLKVKVPGREFSVPSNTKLIFRALNNYHGADKLELIKRYNEIGTIKRVSRLYHEALDDLSFSPQFSPNQWYNKVNGAVDKLADFTGNNFSEELTRFVTSDVMRQLTDPAVKAGRMSINEQNAFMGTFVNRVQGNYVTSQRPVVFQGTTGAAVSLFQTYAFNVLQQLHRHTELGDKRTLAVFAGLQSSVFGFNGLPFFDAVNTHLIGSMAANNPNHNDAYNVLPAFNKELGDWLLYGTASAFPLFTGSMPALYTRGDINPRHLSVLPTNIVDVPAVSASIKLADTVYNFGKNLVKGTDLSSAMLQGLEHQGWSRPLAGFAQLLGGRSTTSKGSLISAANDMQATSWLGSLADRTVNYGGVSRLLGARPMDEAVALNQMYRNKSYEALDRARLTTLGRVVKSKLYNNESPTSEEMDDFMIQYTKSGGRIDNFSQFMQRAMKDANVSVINQTAAKLGSSTGRKMQQLMGGDSIPDYWNQE